MPLHHSSSLNQQSLASRLIVRTLILAVCLALIIALTLSALNYRQNLAQLEQQVALIEQSYLPSLAKGLWEVDPPRLNILLDGIIALQHIAAVKLTTEQGETLQRLPEYPVRIFGQTEFRIYFQHEKNQVYVGLLTLTLTNQQIRQHAIIQGIFIAAASIFAVMLSTLLLLTLFKKMVSRHLKTLAVFANQLDPNQINTPLQLDREEKNDELDALVSAFNRLQEKIKAELTQRAQYEAELELNKTQLEQKVRLRTEALQLANNELEQTTQMLMQQNKDLDAYARTVAHDLKTPLTSIIYYVKILQSSFSTQQHLPKQPTLCRIETIALKMNQIIDALLLLASIRQTVSVPIVKLDMPALIQHALERFEHDICSKQISIQQQDDWPDALGYPVWIAEVWANYISNAIKYGGETPKISLGARETTDFCEFWVADCGRVLSAEEQTQLFSDMRRFEPDKAEGYGFGLAIVKRIIEQLAGQVGYRPSVEGGSLFWFRLPKA